MLNKTTSISLFACIAGLLPLTAHAQNVTLEAGTLFNPGTTWNADARFTSQSSDPTAPFGNQSVHYRGWQEGGSAATLNGARRVFRQSLDFSAPVSVNSIKISGAAFNGPNNVFRLLDSNNVQVATVATSGGNTYQTINLNASGVTGSKFYLEEYDTSSSWRYRDSIQVDFTGSATMTQTALDAPTHAAGTWFWGNVGLTSESSDPLAPFNGQAATFRGYTRGGSQETLNGAHLAYRYRLDYASDVFFDSFNLDGAAFNGPNSILRLLDANRNVIGTTSTSGANTIEGLSLRQFSVSGGGVLGKTFYVEEYDTSTDWRYRNNFVANVRPVPEPATMLALAGGLIALRRRRR